MGAVLSFPLPKDHWLYERDTTYGEFTPDGPIPVLDPRMRPAIIRAARWAIQASTDGGKIKDFDPDAMVLNFAYALVGSANPTAPEERQDAAV